MLKRFIPQEIEDECGKRDAQAPRLCAVASAAIGAQRSVSFSSMRRLRAKASWLLPSSSG